MIDRISRTGGKGHYVVTGCSDHGLTWMSTALVALGHPVGDSWAFDVTGCCGWGKLDGDASWMAAPLLGEIQGPCAVMHLVSDPLDAVAAAMGDNLIDDEPVLDYVERWFPEVRDISQRRERYAAWVVMWNRLVEAKSAERFNRRFRFDTMMEDPQELSRGVLFLTGIVYTEDDCLLAAKIANRKHPAPSNDHSWFDGLSGYWYDQLRLMREDYGYGEGNGI